VYVMDSVQDSGLGPPTIHAFYTRTVGYYIVLYHLFVPIQSVRTMRNDQGDGEKCDDGSRSD
jgi:hypothetical protein